MSTEPLVGEKTVLLQTGENRGVRDYAVFAALFGLNHGTITATLMLSSSFLGQTAAGLGNGTLYAMFGSVALLAAAPVVRAAGARRVLLFSMALYCAYPGALFASSFPGSDTAWAIVGGLLGGMASGCLWTAQGTYFTASAAQHARATGLPPASATASLATCFASIFLGLEIVCKLGTSMLLRAEASAGESVSVAHMTLLASFTGLAILSAALAPFLVAHVPEVASSDGPRAGSVGTQLTETMGAAVRLTLDDPTILLLTPFNLAFGLGTALLQGVVNGNLAAPVVGEASVGLLGGLSVGVAAMSTYPLSQLSGRKGSCLAFAAGAQLVQMGVVALLASKQPQLVAEKSMVWGMLVVIYVLQGVSRAAFESVCKSLTADLFPKRAPAAFANIIFPNAYGTALGFVCFPAMPVGVAVGTVALVAASAIPASLYASKVAAERVESGKGRRVS